MSIARTGSNFTPAGAARVGSNFTPQGAARAGSNFIPQGTLTGQWSDFLLKRHYHEERASERCQGKVQFRSRRRCQGRFQFHIPGRGPIALPRTL